MKRLLLSGCLLFSGMAVFSNSIVVRNIDELKKANTNAHAGDTIILQNGEWNNVTIALNCKGTREHPIVFRAQSAGKVNITGHSQLKLGGDFIVVDGMYFTNGFAGDDAVINFRIDKNQLANNCRVTNCVVYDFNNPKRMDENNWIAFYGKNNRLDHCSFIDKKNMGVLLAVILDDDRSRENFHSIDHNYFGKRIPLASNGGEIIRVGVSQHCQFNSNTQIVDNFFEHCDGETEIISIKSGHNIVRNNLFRECQGGVVLRHGDNNTVENNIFLGNDKEGTGGVRVINKGQWVVNNLFYKCRGVDFRSPLSVMNGIPNSPAFRYVQVSDAVIANNTFYNCSPVSFCEGSDTERTLPPQNVYLVNNTFYNTEDSSIYKTYDNMAGFHFANNMIDQHLQQEPASGFVRTPFTVQKDIITVPAPLPGKTGLLSDSLQEAALARLSHKLPEKTGFMNLSLFKKVYNNANKNCGAGWFEKINVSKPAPIVFVNCSNAEDIYKQLARKEPVIIRMRGSKFVFNKPLVISKRVIFTGDGKTSLAFSSDAMQSLFLVAGNGNLSLRGLIIDGGNVQATNFMSNESNGSSNHYSISIRDCTFKNLDREKGCRNLLYAYKYMVADSIVFCRNNFLNSGIDGIMMNEEKDNRGYYSAEKITVTGNRFDNLNGVLLDIYRGGNDESTMGPLLIVRDNTAIACTTGSTGNPLIHLFGVQRTFIEKNNFRNCNTGSVFIRYDDLVRANHTFISNTISQTGKIITDKFVRSSDNTIN